MGMYTELVLKCQIKVGCTERGDGCNPVYVCWCRQASKAS